MIPYWGVYLKSLGYSSKDVGFMSAIILATRIIAPNFWGWLADKTDQRLLIIRMGSACAAVFFASIFISQKYGWLLIVITCYTFFWHAVLPQFEVITLNYLGAEFHRYGQIRLWGSVGFMAIVVCLGWIFDYWSVALLPIAILTFLSLIWLSSLSLPNVSFVRSANQAQGFLALVRQPAMISFLSSSFLLQLSHGPYYTFYSLYLQENYAYSSTATGLLWALGVLAEVGIFWFMPKLMRGFSVRQLLLLSFFIAGVRWMLISYGASWLWVLLLAQLLHAFSFGTAHGASIEIVRNHFKGGHQGQGQALYSSFSFGAGGALGALLGGLLWDYSSHLTFILASLASALAFVIAYFGLHLLQAPEAPVSQSAEALILQPAEAPATSS